MPLQVSRVQPTPQTPFGQLHPRPGESGDLGGHLIARFQQVLARHLTGYQPDPLGLGGVDITAGEHQLERARGSDGARQQIAQPQLAGRQPIVDTSRAEVGRGRRDPDVGGQRKAQTTTDSGAVHRGNHRLVHPPQAQDHLVKHFHRAKRIGGPRQSLRVRHCSGRLVIGTRGEPSPGSGQHDDPHIVVVGDVLDYPLQRHHDVERHRVHPLRTVEGDKRHIRAGTGNKDEFAVAAHGSARYRVAAGPTGPGVSGRRR